MTQQQQHTAFRGIIFLFWRVWIAIPHSSYSDSYESLEVLMSLMASHTLNKSQAWATLTTHSQTSRCVPIHAPPHLLSSRVIFLPYCGFQQLLPQAILQTVWIPLLTQSECSLLPNYPTRLPRWIKTCSRTAPLPCSEFSNEAIHGGMAWRCFSVRFAKWVDQGHSCGSSIH